MGQMCSGPSMGDQDDRKQLTEVRAALEHVDDVHGCGKVGALKKIANTPFFSKYTFFDPDGKNRSIEKLGEGGFSKVFRGFQRGSQGGVTLSVAVKCTDMKQVKVEESEGDLLRERDMLMALNHKNIVRCYDFFSDKPNAIYWMVLEIVEGGELFERITAKTVYNEAEARTTILMFLDALAYLHDKKIAHRDLKPENLLLKSKDEDTQLKIADFGFAIETDGDNLKQGLGTPNYIAPEIVKGANYGIGVDMWAAGVIMFILLGGYPPFYEDGEENNRNIIKGKFKFKAEWGWSAVTDEAKDLIKKMLTVKKEDRITARQAMRHEWFIHDESDLMHHNLETSLQQFKTWNAKRKFKGAVRGVMASNRMKKLLSGLKKASTEIDQEADPAAPNIV